MENRLFVYTRLKNQDYHKIYSPGQNFIPRDVENHFTGFVREVINEDRISNGRIVMPRWCFYKFGGFFLYGIGCRNEILSGKSIDPSGRSIRGFFGFITRISSNEPISIWTNIEAIGELYKEKVEPLFDSVTEVNSANISSDWEPSSLPVLLDESLTYLHINSKADQTNILPDKIDIRLIAASVAQSVVETNVVFHLNNEGHIKHTRLSHFFNATIIDNDNEYIINKSISPDSKNIDESNEHKEKNNAESHGDYKGEDKDMDNERDGLREFFADACIIIGEKGVTICEKIVNYGKGMKKKKTKNNDTHLGNTRTDGSHKKEKHSSASNNAAPKPQRDPDWLSQWQTGNNT